MHHSEARSGVSEFESPVPRRRSLLMIRTLARLQREVKVASRTASSGTQSHHLNIEPARKRLTQIPLAGGLCYGRAHLRGSETGRIIQLFHNMDPELIPVILQS